MPEPRIGTVDQALAKAGQRYGLADRESAKLCQRMGIPVPGRGHWTRLQVGPVCLQPKFPVTKPPS
jgi:hypothetical protein